MQRWPIHVVFIRCHIHIFQKRENTPLVRCLNVIDGKKRCRPDEKLSLKTLPTHLLAAIFQTWKVMFLCIWHKNTNRILECLWTFLNGILLPLFTEFCSQHNGLLVSFSLHNRSHWPQLRRLRAINADPSCYSTLCSPNRIKFRGRLTKFRSFHWSCFTVVCMTYLSLL